MSLNQRRPYKYVDDDEHDDQILDEQEQDELVQDLRLQNATYDQQYLLFLQAIIAMSLLLHLLYFFNPTGETPVQFILQDSGPADPIPLPRVFTLINIALHLNLSAIIFPEQLRRLLESLSFDQHTRPLSYQFSYTIAAVAPTLSLFLGRSWSTFLWWTVALGIIFTVQTAQDSINQGKESISSLEAMKYSSPGA